MNVVIDTNVLLSGALRDKLPENVVVYAATRDDIRWIVTPSIIAEYVDVLRRPKFAISPETLASWSELVEMRTVMIADPRSSAESLRDRPTPSSLQPRLRRTRIFWSPVTAICSTRG
jgi:predicted nucleic acid-binding protein